MDELTTFKLDPEEICKAINLLSKRIQERFPNSGLSKVGKKFMEVARRGQRRSQEISKPNISLRVFGIMLILGVVFLIMSSFAAISLKAPSGGVDIFEIIQVLEAGINNVILLSIAAFFLFNLESRFKRRQVLKAMRELRDLAHLIDIRQLTKDPERLLTKDMDTESSPKATMTAFELSRYLEYCSELLDMIGKVATFYIQDFSETQAVAAVNDVDSMTTDMSRKVWQKLMIVHSLRQEEREDVRD